MVVATDLTKHMYIDCTATQLLSPPPVWFAFSFKSSLVRMKSALNNCLMYLDSRLEVTVFFQNVPLAHNKPFQPFFALPAERTLVRSGTLAHQLVKLLY